MSTLFSAPIDDPFCHPAQQSRNQSTAHQLTQQQLHSQQQQPQQQQQQQPQQPQQQQQQASPHRVSGKRPRPDMSALCYDAPVEIVPHKRPRTIITPTSTAISVVTPEAEAATSPEYMAAPHMQQSTQQQQHQHRNHHHQSYYYPVEHYATYRQRSDGMPPPALTCDDAAADAIIPPSPQPSVYCAQSEYADDDNAAAADDDDDAIVMSSRVCSESAPASPASPVMQTPPMSAYAAVPEEEEYVETGNTPPSPVFGGGDDMKLRVDTSNSFSTGHTGAIHWTNDMLVQVLSNEIEEACAANQTRDVDDDDDIDDMEDDVDVPAELHNFFSQNKQPFELDFYMSRLIQYSNCSTAAFVIMLVYMDRVQKRYKSLLLTEMNCHRVILTALVLAIKYVDDEVFSNAHYARVGGVTVKELNELEMKMLSIMEWKMTVSPETYALYEDGLVQSASHFTSGDVPVSPI